MDYGILSHCGSGRGKLYQCIPSENRDTDIFGDKLFVRIRESIAEDQDVFFYAVRTEFKSFFRRCHGISLDVGNALESLGYRKASVSVTVCLDNGIHPCVFFEKGMHRIHVGDNGIKVDICHAPLKSLYAIIDLVLGLNPHSFLSRDNKRSYPLSFFSSCAFFSAATSSAVRGCFSSGLYLMSKRSTTSAPKISCMYL